MCGLSSAAADPAFGPLHHRYELTLENGRRTETLGPLVSVEENEGKRVRRWTPLISRVDDPVGDSTEMDFIYPLLTYDRFGEEYRVHLMQLLAFAGGRKDEETAAKRFTLFPFYFQQRSEDPELNYAAVMPFYGTLKNRLFRDEIKWLMFPLYVQTRKRDIVTDNYLLPFFHLRRGDSLRGWQFWPLVGAEKKEPFARIDKWGEEQLVPGHKKFFAMWPFYFNEWSGLGTENPAHQHHFLPLVATERSPERDSTTLLWPFFTRVDDRKKQYKEWGLPWPLMLFARGEGKTANRVWPFYSRVYNAKQESRFWMWPFYKSNSIHSEPLDRTFARVLFFLYQDLRQRDTETGESMWRRDLWPLFTARRDWDGGRRIQVFALLEPLLRASDSIERNYSPIWSIWRSENNPSTGASSHSFLWNLWRSEKTADTRKCSIFFGLVQYETGPSGRRWKWLHLPRRKRAEDTESETLAPDEGVEEDMKTDN